MAVILYRNGLTEEYVPKNLVFSENELIDLFKDYDNVKTKRIIPLLNTWCIYGVDNEGEKDPDDYNRIASAIAKDTIYTNVLFVHDTEIDPDWNMTDDIIYKSYTDFRILIEKMVIDVAEAIISELEEHSEDVIISLPLFSELGVTTDKKLIFGFNPDEQTNQFYSQGFNEFSEKVYKYLSINRDEQKKTPFKIYEDNKAIIIIDPDKVKSFLSILLNNFKEQEEYEICTEISNMINDWSNNEKNNKINNNKENNSSDNKSNE